MKICIMLQGFYTSDNCCIIVVGDVDENNVLKLANETYIGSKSVTEKLQKQEDEINKR